MTRAHRHEIARLPFSRLWREKVAGEAGRMRALAASAALIFAVVPTLADPAAPFSAEIHYSPAENLEAIDVALIAEAGDALDIAAYVLTDWAVIDALIEAADRGVKIRLLRESTTSGYGDAGELGRLTGAANVESRIKPPGALMHFKSYCLDGRALRTGSANFSASGEKRQDNDLAILRGDGVCAGFERAFDREWGEAK